MLKVALLITVVSVTGCGSVVPAFPEIYQCGYDHIDGVFRCINTKTQERKLLHESDPSMNGAQCTSLDDYRKSEAWVAQVKEIAETRCR